MQYQTQYFPWKDNIHSSLLRRLSWSDTALEVDKLDCWSKDFQPSAEVARVCVRKDLQGQGIAKMMMEHVFTVLREQNKKSVHILVRDNHKAALKCYSDLGFVPVGECELFEKHFVCMEKSL